MFANPDPDLKYRFLWLALGYAIVMLIVYLSLTSNPVSIGMSFLYQDKFFHAFAYFVLMSWFMQIYHDRFQRNMIALVFIFMGITLEYLQSYDRARMFEIADMVANAIGVALGFALALTRAKNCLLRFEQKIFSR